MSSASSNLGNIPQSRPDQSCASAPADDVADPTQTAGSKRRKTFTGCWTCRRRHVKCDEQRPACKRCVAGNLTCEGYGTRLTWLTPMGLRSAKNSRSYPFPAGAGVSVGVDASPRNSYAGPRVSERRKSPRKRIHSDQPSRAAVTAEQVRQNDPETMIPTTGTVQNTENNPTSIGLGGKNTASSIYYNNLAFVSDNNNNNNNNNNNPPHYSFSPSLDSSSWPPGMECLPHSWHSKHQQMPNRDFAISSLFDNIPVPRIGGPMKPFAVAAAATRERELINHWATHLADKLVPFRSPANPFLTVVCPMVLEGVRIARTRSSCTVALFHAVCAISAAHQSNLKAFPMEEGLLDHHKQLSFQHLMQNMNHTDHDERMACLATLCLWILIHFVTGTPGAWRQVTKVTRELLERISAETWGQSATAVLTYQSFSTSFALIQAQYLGRQESPAPLQTSLPDVDKTKSQIITPRSLELLSSFNSKLMRDSGLATEELDQLEIEFGLSTPEPSTDFDTDNTPSALVHYHRSLFYYASLLYFRGNSGRRGPEEEVQTLVHRCLDHMEHIDLLQQDNNPKTWIYAAVAFEALIPQLRDRARRLFSKRMSVGIATWNTLLVAVEEVWKRRDAALAGFAPDPWTRVLARMPELDVILY